MTGSYRGYDEGAATGMGWSAARQSL